MENIYPCQKEETVYDLVADQKQEWFEDSVSNDTIEETAYGDHNVSYSEELKREAVLFDQCDQSLELSKAEGEKRRGKNFTEAQTNLLKGNF